MKLLSTVTLLVLVLFAGCGSSRKSYDDCREPTPLPRSEQPNKCVIMLPAGSVGMTFTGANGSPGWVPQNFTIMPGADEHGNTQHFAGATLDKPQLLVIDKEVWGLVEFQFGLPPKNGVKFFLNRFGIHLDRPGMEPNRH